MKILKSLIFIIFLLTCIIYYYSCDETITNQIIAQLVTHGWVVGDSTDGYGFILNTTDAGSTWNRQGDSSMLANISLNDLAVVDKQTVWIVGTQGSIIHTNDGGSSWQKQTSPPTDVSINLESIYATDKNNAWISAGSSLVLHTVNGGNTWNRVTVTGAPSDINLQGICAADENNIWTVGQDSSGNEGYIYHSSNAGTNWNRVTPTIMPSDSATWIGVKALNVNEIWIHGSVGKLIRTTDAGQTWIHIPTPLEQGIGGDLNDLYLYNENIIYAACDWNHILFTTNAGTNWQLQNAPTPPSNQFLFGVHATTASTAWVVGISAGFPQQGNLIYTTNSGTNWQLKMVTNNNLSKIAFVK